MKLKYLHKVVFCAKTIRCIKLCTYNALIWSTIIKTNPKIACLPSVFCLHIGHWHFGHSIFSVPLFCRRIASHELRCIIESSVKFTSPYFASTTTYSHANGIADFWQQFIANGKHFLVFGCTDMGRHRFELEYNDFKVYHHLDYWLLIWCSAPMCTDT